MPGSLRSLQRYLPFRALLAEAGASVLAADADPAGLAAATDAPFAAIAPAFDAPPPIALRHGGAVLPFKTGAFHTVVAPDRPLPVATLARVAAARLILGPGPRPDAPPGWRVRVVPVPGGPVAGLLALADAAPDADAWAAALAPPERDALAAWLAAAPAAAEAYVLERERPLAPIADLRTSAGLWAACACPACGGDLEGEGAPACLGCGRAIGPAEAGVFRFDPAEAPPAPQTVFALAPRWRADDGWRTVLLRYIDAFAPIESCFMYLIAPPAAVPFAEAVAAVEAVLAEGSRSLPPAIGLAMDEAHPALARAVRVSADPDGPAAWSGARFRHAQAVTHLDAALRRVTGG